MLSIDVASCEALGEGLCRIMVVNSSFSTSNQTGRYVLVSSDLV